MAGLPKIGTTVAHTGEAFHSLSKTMEWTYSQYDKIKSQATDKIVFPIWNWTWSKLWQASSEPDPSTPVKPPKRSKRCGRAADCLVQPVILITRKVKKLLTPEFLHRACQSVKRCARPYAHAKPVKIPDLEKYNRFGQAAGYACETIDKAGIQAAAYLYFIADAGEKTWSIRLCLDEISPELRPSFKKNFLEPILEDLEKMIRGSEPDLSDTTLREALLSIVVSGVRSEMGQEFDKRVKPAIISAVDEYLKSKEEKIKKAVAKIQDEAQSKAINWGSGYLVRQSLHTFVTPVLMSGALSFSAYLLAFSIPEDAGGILATVRTTAYLLSYLKYINHLLWIGTTVKSAYNLHRTYSDTFGDRITNILKGSPSQLREWMDQMKEARTYSVIVAKECDLPAIITVVNGQIPAKTGIKFLDGAVADSPALKYFKPHFDRFTKDVKEKSIATLRKYDMIALNDELDDFQDCPPYQEDPDPATAPPPAPSPAAQLLTRASGAMGLSLPPTAAERIVTLATVVLERKEPGTGSPIPPRTEDSSPPLPEAPSSSTGAPAPSPAAQLVSVAGPAIGLSSRTTATLVSLAETVTNPKPPEAKEQKEGTKTGPSEEPPEHPPTRPSLVPAAVELGKKVFTALSSPNPTPEASPSPTETTSTQPSSPKPNLTPMISDWIKKVAVVGAVASVALLGFVCFRNFSAVRALLNDLSNGKFGEGSNLMRAIFSSAIALLRQSTDNRSPA